MDTTVSVFVWLQEGMHPYHHTCVSSFMCLSMMLCVFSDICLQPGTIGGIEADSTERSWPSHDSLNTVDGRCHEEMVPLSALLNGLCLFIHATVQLLIIEK